MNKLELNLLNTLEAMSRVQRSQYLPKPKINYILECLERRYNRLNKRFEKQYGVRYNPGRDSGVTTQRS